jgi:DNA-binding transcriptional LysR family regulator
MFSMDPMPSSHELLPSILRVFAEVARLGSFTSAASALGFTQSAISRQVLALENGVSAQLFDRLPRGVQLTEAGRRFLPHAEAVLDRLDEARRELADLGELAKGRLRVGAFATADAALVPEALAEFTRRYPGLPITLREGFTPDLLELVRDGDVDVAIVSFADVTQIEGFDLGAICLDHMRIALPAGHHLARRRMVHLAELADEVWIAGSSRPEDTLISSCLQNGFAPKIGFVAKDWMAKQGFVAAGIGITLIPSLAESAVRSDICLVHVHPADIPPRHIYAVTANGLSRTAAADAFLEILLPGDSKGRSSAARRRGRRGTIPVGTSPRDERRP